MMRLSDIMSHAGLWGYAVAAMLLFMGAFLAIVFGVLRRTRGDDDHAGRLPLDDDAGLALPGTGGRP